MQMVKNSLLTFRPEMFVLFEYNWNIEQIYIYSRTETELWKCSEETSENHSLSC